MNFFKRLDFMSIEPRLFVNSMSRYKNAWGALGSLISMLFTLIATIYFSIELFEKKKPKVIYNEEVNDDPFLDLTNFPFMFSVIDNYGNQFDFPDKLYNFSPLVYRINYKKIDAKGNPEIAFININFSRCDNFTNFNITSDFQTFEKRKNNSYCLDTSREFRLRGYLYDPTNEDFHFSIKVRKCRNSTANAANPCFPKETMDYELSRSSLYLSYIDYKVNNNLERKSQPNTPNFKSHLISMNSYMSKQTRILFRNVNYEIDDGLFFKNKQSINFLKQSEIENDYFLLDPGVTTFMNVIFSMSISKESYSVSYEKIVNVLANVSAIWNVLFYIGQLLVNYMINDLFYLYVCFYNKIIDSENHLITSNKEFFKRNHTIFQKLRTVRVKNFTEKKSNLDPSNNDSSILENLNVNNFKHVNNHLNSNNERGPVLKNGFWNLEIKKNNKISNYNSNKSKSNYNSNSISNSKNCSSVSLKNEKQLRKESQKLGEFRKQNEQVESNYGSKHGSNNKEMSSNNALYALNNNDNNAFEKIEKIKNRTNNKNEANDDSNNEDSFNVAKIYKSNNSNSQLPSQKVSNFNSIHLHKNHNGIATAAMKNTGNKRQQISKSNRTFKGFNVCFFLRKSVNKILFEKLSAYVNKKLSIEEILRKILEIDKLKFLVFKNMYLQTLFYQMPTKFAFEKEFDDEFNSFNLSAAKNNFNLNIKGNNDILTKEMMIKVRNFWSLNEFA